MWENKNDMDEFKCRLQKELQEEAERIEKDVQKHEEEKPKYVRDSDLTPKQRKELHARIYAEVEANNRAKVYAQLSNEDLEALELGKKILAEGKVARKKKKIRGYVGLAATLVLVLGISVNSFGGPEKVITEMKRMIGRKEVAQVDSSKNIATDTKKTEAAAYQQIEEELGVRAVRIAERPNGMKFRNKNLNNVLQTAELIYDYQGESIIYYINASNSDSSWGVNAADEIENQWEEEIKGCKIEIREHNISAGKQKRYSAKFKYNKVSYFINGVFLKEDFEYIINNLIFT